MNHTNCRHRSRPRIAKRVSLADYPQFRILIAFLLCPPTKKQLASGLSEYVYNALLGAYSELTMFEIDEFRDQLVRILNLPDSEFERQPKNAEEKGANYVQGV